jgi:F0F1-type ATP synthase membrane subunit b/b'
MKKWVWFLALLFCAAWITPLVTLAEQGAENNPVSLDTENKPLLDKVGDWFATFGKSTEEKEKILEERQDKKILQEITQGTGAIKEDLGTELLNAQARATQEITQAKEKVANIMGRARAESEKVMAQAKERAQKIVELAKEKAGLQMSEYKEQLKNQAATTLDKAKNFINKRK